jgi:hypothetical protein
MLQNRRKIMNISCCGTLCKKCTEYHKGCAGCRETEGKPGWVFEMGLKQCNFFTCCIEEKKLEHCGKCSEVPCKMFYDCIDPSLTKEAAAKDIADRVLYLRSCL